MDKIKKWEPMLESLKVGKNYYDFFATYAEKLSNEISYLQNEENLLPVNLKLLSKLDMKNINISLIDVDDLNVDFIIRETFDAEQIKAQMNSMNMVSDTKKDIIPKMESVLLDKLADLLNTKKEIQIYKLVSKIGIEQNGSDIEMFIISRIKTN